MNSVHELIVQILSVLIELLQRTDGPAIFRAVSKLFHPVSGWLLGEVVGQVRIMHRDVVVRVVVAVWICEVESGSRAASNAKADSSDLERQERILQIS